MAKRYREIVEVEVGPDRMRAPMAFCWRDRRYPVERLLKYWREAEAGWDRERSRDHECFRVEAAGGTYDLRHDMGDRSPGWLLVKVWD